MQGYWLVLLVCLLLSVVQLAIGVVVGRFLFSGRSKGDVDAARDIQRVRTFAGRLYRLMTGVASDVDRHQVRIQQISKELAAAQISPAPEHTDAVLESISRLIHVNSQLQRRLHVAEEKLDRQAAQIETHVLEARVDPMTGLLNRGAFDEALRGRLSAWQSSGLCFCLMMLDLDQFKPLNDRYGHLAGDMALRHIADMLREDLTDLDVIARIGGDEFAVILPRTAPEDARCVARRICDHVSASRFVFHEDELAVTTSLGLAAAQPGDDAVSLMKRADEALYASKRAGRNRAYFHDGQQCQPLGAASEAAQGAGGSTSGGPLAGVSLQGLQGPETVCEQLRRQLRQAVDVEPAAPAQDQSSQGGTP